MSTTAGVVSRDWTISEFVSTMAAKAGDYVREKGEGAAADAIGRMNTFLADKGFFSEYRSCEELEVEYAALQQKFASGQIGPEQLQELTHLLNHGNTVATQTLWATLALGVATITVLKVAHVAILRWVPFVSQVSSAVQVAATVATAFTAYELYAMKKAIAVAQDCHVRYGLEAYKTNDQAAMRTHVDRVAHTLIGSFRSSSYGLVVMRGVRDAWRFVDVSWTANPEGKNGGELPQILVSNLKKMAPKKAVAPQGATSRKSTLSGGIGSTSLDLLERGQQIAAKAIGQVKLSFTKVGLFSNYQSWEELALEHANLQQAFSANSMKQKHVQDLTNLLEHANTNVTQTLMVTLAMGAVAIAVMEIAHNVLGWIPVVSRVSGVLRSAVWYTTAFTLHELYLMRKAVLEAQDYHLIHAKDVHDGNQKEAIRAHTEMTMRILTSSFKANSCGVAIIPKLAKGWWRLESYWTSLPTVAADPIDNDNTKELLESATPMNTPVKKRRSSKYKDA